MYKYALNIFHIILVASLLCTLAKNLADGNDYLKYSTYGIVTVMVLWHLYRIYQKSLVSE